MENKLEKIKNDPFYCRLYKKLKDDDLVYVQSFYDQNLHLTKDEYFKKVNRLYMDQVAPKNVNVMCEILHVMWSA